MATKQIYDHIDRPYDHSLPRKQDETNLSNGGVEDKPVKSSGSMGDVWIKTFIRSDNWKPKKVGFYIDGQTGYAEFTNVFVSGEIDNGLLNIVGNDITIYDESTSGDPIVGNSGSIIFVRDVGVERKEFIMQGRASLNGNDNDFVFELFPTDNAYGRNYIFIGRDGNVGSNKNKDTSALVFGANIDQEMAMNDLRIECKYDSVSASWGVIVLEDMTGLPLGVFGVEERTWDAGGGTVNLVYGIDKSYQRITGTAALGASWVIQGSGTPTAGST